MPGRLPYPPITYITYHLSATDGNSHKVKLYYDNTAEVCSQLAI
jgi:hypothetical protein